MHFETNEAMSDWVAEHIQRNGVEENIAPSLVVEYMNIANITSDHGWDWRNPRFGRAVFLLGGTKGSYLEHTTREGFDPRDLAGVIAMLDPEVDLGLLAPFMISRR